MSNRFQRAAEAERPAESRRRAGELLIVERRIEGEAVVLRLEGSLDLLTCAAVREEVAALEDAAPVVRLDLEGVDFMDSSGLRLLLGLTDGAGPARSAMQLVRPSAAVMRVVDITGTAGRLRL